MVERVPLLVRGAGVTGVLSALKLGERAAAARSPDAAVFVHENSKWNADSYHAQCILHHGYAYVGDVDREQGKYVINELKAGSVHWQSLINRFGLPISGSGVLYAFKSNAAAASFCSRLKKFLLDDDGCPVYVGAGASHSGEGCNRILDDLPVLMKGGSLTRDLGNASPCAQMLDSINVDLFQQGEIYASSENIVRPSHVVRKLLQQSVLRLIESSNSDVIGVKELHAVGKEKTRARPHVLLIAVGRLPELRAHFPHFLSVPASWGLMRRGEERPRTTSGVSVISHPLEMNTLWIIESQILDDVAEWKNPQKVHSSEVKLKSDREFKFLIDNLKLLVPSFTPENCCWKSIGAELPSLREIAAPLAERAIKVDGQCTRVSVERFTMAALAAEAVAEKMVDLPLQSDVGNQAVLEIDESCPLDRWAPLSADAADFAAFPDFVSDFCGSGNP